MRFLPFILVLGLPLCCGLPHLIGLGALGAVGGWLADGPGLAIVAGVGILGLAVLMEVRRRRGQSRRGTARPAMPAAIGADKTER